VSEPTFSYADSVINRRTFLIGGAALVGAAGAMPSTPACTLIAEQEEGPYYVDYDKVRADITEGKPGVPLKLRVALVDAKRCTPLINASLDIWHCDAQGVYSGFTANGGGFGHGPGGPPPDTFGFGPPPGGGPARDGGPPPRGHHALDATRFLRGIQATDANGMVEFSTIYPGWYEGRTIHVHLKVHTGGHVAHTGQLFFPEDVTARIAKLQPYSKHRDVHRTTLSEDHVYEEEHGAAGMVALNRMEGKPDAAGFVATVTLAVDPEAIPEPVGMRGPGFPGPRR
jgi:protocatechuate 3,4-dioxygenase beta subunit